MFYVCPSRDETNEAVAAATGVVPVSPLTGRTFFHPSLAFMATRI